MRVIWNVPWGGRNVSSFLLALLQSHTHTHTHTRARAHTHTHAHARMRGSIHSSQFIQVNKIQCVDSICSQVWPSVFYSKVLLLNHLEPSNWELPDQTKNKMTCSCSLRASSKCPNAIIRKQRFLLNINSAWRLLKDNRASPERGSYSTSRYTLFPSGKERQHHLEMSRNIHQLFQPLSSKCWKIESITQT